MTALFWTAAGLGVLALAAYFLICALLVHKFLSRKPDDPDGFLDRLAKGPNARHCDTIRSARPWYLDQPKEDVYIESFDGLKLHGCYLSQNKPRGTMLLVHGFHGSGHTDFSCVLRDYYEMGFDLLVIDQRAHLQSEGKYLTMGVLERYDVRSWCIWLLQRHGESHRVVLDGISMGGATVLMASGLDLPKNVVGIIADCPFTSPREIFVSVMGQMGLPTWLLWGANQYCRLFAGFSIDGASTVEALRHNTLPLVIAHGADDDFVPPWMGQKSFDAATVEDKQLILVPGATHGMSFLVDRDRVRGALVAFLDKYCPKG